MSPTVWADAKARLIAGAPTASFAWPNDPYTLAEPPALWVAVETQGEGSRPIELGAAATWMEHGVLYLHVMVPVGAGIDAAMMLRKTLSDLFRNPAGLAAGLSYEGFRWDPMGPATDDGVYRPLSLAIEYRYQDR